VHGDKARLYVQGAPRPTMVVNDLKQTQGKIALCGLELKRSRTSPIYAYHSDFENQRCAIDISSGYTSG